MCSAGGVRAMRMKRCIEVEHPMFGRYMAVGVSDKLEAAMEAAKVWKTQWSMIAGQAFFREDGKQI